MFLIYEQNKDNSKNAKNIQERQYQFNIQQNLRENSETPTVQDCVKDLSFLVYFSFTL